MNKEEFTLLENIKRLDNDMQKEVKVKETKIKILEAEIEQLYEFIAKIQHLEEIEQGITRATTQEDTIEKSI